MAERSLSKRLGYNALRVLARLVGVVVFRIRCQGRHHMPPNGAVLICSNHQSFLDPVLVGLAFDRRLNYLARDSLFKIAPLRWLIEYLDAIPIDREGLGLSGLRESLRRIRRGEIILIFPEGTRTRDGSLLPLHPGFCALARRGQVTLLPVGIDGAFDAWPRFTKLPRPSVIRICVGEPLRPQQVQELNDGQLVGWVEQSLRACHALARRGRAR